MTPPFDFYILFSFINYTLKHELYHLLYIFSIYCGQKDNHKLVGFQFVAIQVMEEKMIDESIKL